MTLALVIPVWNDQLYLDRLLAYAQSLAIFDEIIVVDDGSKPAIWAPQAVKLLRHPVANGPGKARNTGLDAVTSTHLLFFDSDDLLTSEFPLLWEDLASEAFDFCLFRHADSRSIEQHNWTQMPSDDAVWSAAGMGGQALKHIALPEQAILAGGANFPWNKIYRTDFLRQNDLRFPETFLHEDIPFHWFSFLRADRVLASDRVCAIHYVSATGQRMTNRNGPDRLTAFDSLKSVKEAIEQASPKRKEALLPALLTFACGLSRWIRDHLDPAFWGQHAKAVDTLLGRGLETGLKERLLIQAPELERHLADALANPLATPTRIVEKGDRLRIFKTGHHSDRMPLSYPALTPLFEDTIALVDQPGDADMYVFAHVLDLIQAPHDMIQDWHRRQKPIILLSEEPFWDTIWGQQPLEPLIHIETRWGMVPVHQLNHATSDIFDFKHIPYYLLTNHRFANAYSYRFARNAARSVADWRSDFEARSVDLTFIFERRPEPYHWVRWDSADIIGLCSWRTELAEACQGNVERLGQSWEGGRTRFEIGDWHINKLVRLDGRARILGAFENTHQPNYITEKFFDALACGSVPAYYASNQHRLHSFGLPSEAWTNLAGLSPSDGAVHLVFSPTTSFFDAFRATQAQLAALFGSDILWRAERARLGRALPKALQTILK